MNSHPVIDPSLILIAGDVVVDVALLRAGGRDLVGSRVHALQRAATEVRAETLDDLQVNTFYRFMHLWAEKKDDFINVYIPFTA